MTLYEVEIVKIGVLIVASLLISIPVLVNNQAWESTIPIVMVIGILPINLLYAFPFMMRIIKTGGSAGSEGAIVFGLFSNGLLGMVLGVLVFSIAILVAFILGSFVSIYTIYDRLSYLKKISIDK